MMDRPETLRPGLGIPLLFSLLLTPNLDRFAREGLKFTNAYRP